MPSQEAALLSDFLLTPAALRNFLSLEQFTDIFPRSHRENPAVKALYQELQRLRHEDIELVRSNIADEIKRSRPLKRAVTRERRQDDRTAVAGLDPVALEMEEEVYFLFF
jgi:centromere-localized protein 2